MRGRSPFACLALSALCAFATALSSAGPVCAEIAPPLSVQWTFSAEPDPRNTTTPVVQGDHVYFTHLGVVRCLDARTGERQWEFSPESAGIITSPVPYEDLIIVGGTDAKLYALDAATGREVWDRTCDGAICPDPLILDGLLMVAAQQMVYAIDPDTGEPKWVCALTSTAGAGPVTDGSMLYFLCQDSSIQCVDATTGRYRWRCQFTPGPRIFDPIVGQRRAIVASGNLVYGIARSGSIAWTREMPAGVRARPTLADDMLFVPCVDGEIYTLSPRSGALIRGTSLKVEDPITAPPLVTNTVVAAGTGSGMVSLLDRDSGRVQWVYRCLTPEQPADEGAEFGIYAPIVAADDAVYCLTGSGDLYCFAASAADVAGPAFAEHTPERGSAQPGGRLLDIRVAVTDAGSGVDASSIAATIDGVTADASFEVASGVALIRAPQLRDGSHIVKVTARDYRGNVGTTEWSFLTDVSIRAAPEEGPEARTRTIGLTRGRQQ